MIKRNLSPSEVYFIALEGYSNSNASNNGVCIDNVVVADGTCSLPATPTQPFGSNCCFGGMTTSISCSTSSSGATSYEWSSQQPGVISSGQGSSSVSVGNVLCGSIYTVCVTPHNSCGYGPSRLGSVCNDPGDQSLNGSTINGNPTPCIGSTQTYYDSDVANVSGFHWDYPSGWTVISEDNTGTYVSITLIVGSSSGEIKLFGTGLNELCGACPVIPLSFPVNPITVPNAPSAISGNTTPCQSSNTTYSVSNVSGVSYNWTVPSGWSINNGQGTNQISVTVGSSSGNITVTPSNTCGSGTSTSLWVTPNLLPNQPSPISGDTVMCEKDTLNYSIIDEGFQYNWSFPSGWIQISGGNNNSVSVLSSNVSGTITVTPSNICGNGPPSTLYVSPLSVPANQGQITGNNYPCYGDTEIYILSNPIADYYLWSLPTNWSIISGDSTATITTLIGDSSGQITMFPYNTCGEGDSSNLYVSVNNSTPSITTIYGNNSPCDNSQEYYYITANPEENYLWSLPTGYTFVSGQGTDSILVNIGNTADTIILIPSNSCGFGDTSKIFIDPIPLVYSDVNILANPGFSICEGTSVILNPSPTNGGNNPTFQWFVNDTLFNNTDTITLSSIQDSLEIFVIMTVDTTCPANNPVSSDTSYFTVFNNPSVNIFGDSIACGNTTLNVDTGQSVVEYLWSTGDTTQTILATSSGIYTITITDTNNCKNSDSLYITINPIPSIYLGADTILCEKDSITLAVDTNFSYFSWSTGDTVSNITIDSSGIGIDTVNIFVQVIDSNGCSNSDTIQIIFDDCTKLISLNNKEITIYPNPTTSKIIINGQNIVSITVTDLLGKQLYYSGKNIKYIDLGKFQDGIYIIKISTPKGIISKKIILAK